MPSPTGALLNALQGEFVAAGLGRTPGTTGTLPPVWIMPRGGPPAPGEKTGVEDHPSTVVSLVYTGGIPPRPRYPYHRQVTVDLVFRTKGNAPIERGLALENDLRQRIVDRYGFTLAAGRPEALPVIACTVFNEMAVITYDEQGARQRATYLFEILQTGVGEGA